MATRYFQRFEKADGSEVAVFKSNRYEYEQTQGLQLAAMPLTGESYSFDNQGTEPSIKVNAIERVRFLDVDDEEGIDDDIDNFKRIFTWGIGKIVTKGANGVERWAWGRPTDMPNISFTVEMIHYAPIIMSFDRSSDFYGTAHDEPFNVADPTTVVVTNNGNADAYDSIIIIKGPATNPSISNLSALLPGSTTLFYKIETTRDLAAGTDWLKWDARTGEVLLSANSGATWTDDSVNVVLQDGQVRPFLFFKPGANSLLVDNVGGDIQVLFTEAWH